MKFIDRLPDWQFYLIVAVLSIIIGFCAVSVWTTSNGDGLDANGCKGACVSLKQNKATPNKVEISQGSYVQFEADDGKSHSISLGKGGEDHEHNGKFSSGEFDGSKKGKMQFNEVGTFTLHDHFNPQISITVVVK